MTANSEHNRRDDLARSVAEHFIAEGTSRSSLRDIATAVGTSARMLLHYFGTREELVDAALEVARARQLAAAEKTFANAPDVDVLLRNVWRWYVRADTRRYFLLFNDVAALERAVAPGQRQFGVRLGSEWLPMFEQVFSEDPRLAQQGPDLARLLVATIRGFVLDLHNGVTVKQQKAAYDLLVRMILAHRAA